MNILHKYITSIILFATSLLIFIGCENDYSYRPTATSLSLSADTVSFDTIFTGRITETSGLLVYNESGENLIIDRIYLGKGDKSHFNVNINGCAAPIAECIRLQKRDSLYIFVNVEPPATNDNQPFAIEDDLIVEAGSNRWTAKLLAYGQNYIPLTGNISTDMQLTDNKPYIVSGDCIVDSVATLSAGANTKIYFSENASLTVYGTLCISGTRDKNVVIKSTRLYQFYDDIPGQWGAITLMPGSKKNIIEFAEIANATYGIIADSTAELTMRNTVVRDASRGGIVAYGAKINIANALMYNCGGALLAVYGGECTLVHSTLSNYFRWNIRRQATVQISSELQCPKIDQVTIANSIIVGNLTYELLLDSAATNNILITNTLLKSNLNYNDDIRYANIITETSPLFRDSENFDFHLVPASIAIDLGDMKHTTATPLDFDGNSRIADSKPDLGAFEYVERDK